jgi:eukaryotic-like serine/threonine-protein kinase
MAAANASVLDRFTDEEVLGRGPLGLIYAAVETATGRRVALRGFTRPENARAEHWQQAIDRYTEELTRAQALDHPSIARIFEFEEERGLYYVISEWFDGESLQMKLDKGERWSGDEAIRLISQAGEALDYAAKSRAYHGDITPFNLILSQDGAVHVVNFGLAHSRSKRSSLYRAPEEILGYEGDPRSDLFCLGLILFQMLEGRHPFAPGTPEEVHEWILRAPTPPLTKTPFHIHAVVRKLLAKNTSDRYRSWADAAADLEHARSAVLQPDADLDLVPDLSPNPLVLPSLAEYDLDSSDPLQIGQSGEQEGEPGSRWQDNHGFALLRQWLGY